jgi:DNA repair exonuclease SbcCD ATPase subunit
MLHTLAERFGLQIIMVSHNEKIIAGADNLITVEK